MGKFGERRQGRTARSTLAAAAVALVTAGCTPGFTWRLAGNGGGGTSGDGGSATAATITAPTALLAIPGGGFYISDGTDCVIRKVDGAGKITRFAGTAGTCGDTGDNGPATSAEIDNATFSWVNMGLDSAGNLYFATYGVAGGIRKVATDGTITSLTVPVPSGSINGLSVAPDGTITYLDSGLSGSAAIRRRSPDGVVTKLADIEPVSSGLAQRGPNTFVYSSINSATAGLWSVDTTTGTSTQLSTDSGFSLEPMTASSDGTLYLGYGNRLVRIAADGTRTTIAGNGTADPATGIQAGQATTLALTPEGLAVTPHDGLLVSSGHVVYRLDQPEAAAP